MRLGLISATYPFGSNEPYLDTELRAMVPSLAAVTIVPTNPRGAVRGFPDVPGDVVRLPVVGLSTLALAVRAVARRPRRALGALWAILADRYPVRAKLKNIVVFLKGLAVAEVARANGLDHLHAYWLSTPATVAWVAARVAGIPFSVTAHRWDVYEDNLAARKVREATFVRTISERGRRDLLARTGGDPAKVIVVRLGVMLPLRRDASSLSSVDGPLRILCAAALVPVKGHAMLLGALADLRARGVAFTCTLAGDGPLRDALATEIATRGLDDCVRLAGAIPHDALLAQLQRGEYDVSVIASVERAGGLMEGVPVALIEAMAASAVVVATDSGSIGELVDGASGIVVPHSDPGALADALERVARDADLRRRLGATARARVERDFDVRRTAVALAELFARA